MKAINVVTWHGEVKVKKRPKTVHDERRTFERLTKEQQMLRVHLGHVAHRKSGLVTFIVRL